jgi:Family of unknown function (DUF6498)
LNLALIALANAVLLVGLYALDWAPGTIAFLFWFEAAAIGAVTFVKVAASLPGDVPGSGRSVTYRRPPRPGGRTSVSSSVPRVSAVAALPLFIVFYGVLLAGYGALLLAALKEKNYVALARQAIASGGVLLAMALLVGEHMWAFWRDYLRGPAWQRADPTFHFWKPFGLAIVTWLAFFFGLLVLGWLNSPLVVLTILIVLKAIAELFNALVDAQAGEWQRVDVTP